MSVQRQTDAAWRAFAACARRDGSHRNIVPAIGTGLNAQAGVNMSWGQLLDTVQKKIGVKVALPTGEALIGNTTLAWEAMVSAGAVASGRAPHRVESAMLTTVAQLLREHYRPEGPTLGFARTFLDLGFSDVLSFNFDAVLHVERAEWRHAARPSTSDSPRTKATFRKTTSHAVLPTRGTRLWYPHGFVRFPQTIQLGMRNYGTYMTELEAARARHKALEREIEREHLRGRAGEPSPAERQRIWADQRRRARSWLDVAMTAPLLFVGLSMGREEWPMWWFLNQRARNHARATPPPPVFAFLRAPEADRMAEAARLAGIQLLRFDDYREGWERLLSAFR